MASQIAHIIYARKYLKKHPLPNGNEDLFMLGCVFPDIRRIDETISRKDTHCHFPVLDLDFSSLSPFEAGWKFHLYCDMRREELLAQHGLYVEKRADDFASGPNKLLEDELVYDDYNNWEKLVHFFNNPPKIDTKIGVSRETFCLWYAILAKYLEKRPDSRAIKIFVSKMPSLAPKAAEIAQTVDKLRENAKVVNVLKKVAEEII